MKASLLIPTFFATIGSLSIIFNASPKTEIARRIAKSKDRTSTSNRLSEIGLDRALDFDKFRTKQIVYSASTGFICLLLSMLLRA